MRLTDERIDRMREHVLADVDAAAHRRGRRVRRTLQTTAAACFVLVVGGVGLTALDVSGGPLGPTASDQSSSAEAGPQGDVEGSERSDDLQSAPSASPEQQEDSGRSDGPDLTTQPEPERDVVVTGAVDVVVEHPREAAAQLATWVRARDGRVDSRTEQSYGGQQDGRSSAHLTIRVPVDQVDAALVELDDIGEVTRVDVDREDASAQRRDLDARIDALRTSIKRLETILSEANGSSELLATERAIQERQGELESLEAQRAALSEQVALSTITVNLTQDGETVDDAPADDRDGFVGGLRDGWDTLVEFATGTARVIGVLLPWLAIPLAAWLLWRTVRRLRRR